MICQCKIKHYKKSAAELIIKKIRMHFKTNLTDKRNYFCFKKKKNHSKIITIKNIEIRKCMSKNIMQ